MRALQADIRKFGQTRERPKEPASPVTRVNAMTPVEWGAIGGVTVTFLTGAGIFVKLARNVMTRPEHEKECKKTLDPVREDKHDESTKDLSNKIHDVLLLLRKMNGGT